MQNLLLKSQISTCFLGYDRPVRLAFKPTISLLLSIVMLVTIVMEPIAGQNLQTRYDGVTKDKYISYANFNGSNGITLNLPTPLQNGSLDYSILLWFKKGFDKNLQRMDLIKFDMSLICSFFPSTSIVCSSPTNSYQVAVDHSQVLQDQWAHLAITGSSTKKTYLILQSNTNPLIDSDNSSYISLKQSSSAWTVNLGHSDSSNFFQGGIREFRFFNAFLDQTTISRVKNHYLYWDSSILAYYRFTSDKYLSDEFRNATAIQVGKKNIPTLGYDFLPNDICYPNMDSSQIAYIDAKTVMDQVQFGKSWKVKTTNYGYSFSVSFQATNQTCTANSHYTFKDSCYIFYLENVLGLYMSGQNTANFVIMASEDYYYIKSQDIFVPQGQWVTLQISFQQYKGYEIRGYDLNGKMYFYQNSSNVLYDQVPNQKLNFFYNFIGYAQSLQFFSTNIPLPIDANTISQNTDTLQLNIQLTQKSLSSGSLKNLATGNNQITSLTFTQSPSFKVQTWDDINYKTAGTNGTIKYPSNLFDGIACQDQNLTLQLNSISSYLHTSIPNLNQSFTDMTVEFWFRQTKFINQTGVLFQMWASNQTFKDYFTIKMDSSGYLSCTPFRTTTQNYSIEYSDYDQSASDYYHWFHVVCQFSQYNSVNGYLYSSSDFDENYSLDLSNDGILVPKDKFDIYIGNSQSGKKGTTGLFLKELRIWAVSRDLDDIKLFRNKKLDILQVPSGSLLSYVRMAEASYSEFNMASFLINNVPGSVDISGIQYQSDSQIVICPQTTYYYNNSCFINPVMEIIPTVFPYFNGQSSDLQWMFSGLNSYFLYSSIPSEVQFSWDFDDPIILSTSSSLFSQSQFSIDTSNFIDEQPYWVQLLISSDKESYSNLVEFEFVPISCKYIVESTSQSSYSQTNTYSQPKGEYDVNMVFDINYIDDYCKNKYFYNTLSQNISYQIVPTPLSPISLDFDFSQTDKISVTIPGQEQLKFQTGVQYQIIYSFHWTNNNFDSLIDESNYLFQNAMYTITFTQQEVTVVPSLQPNQQYALVGDQIALDASGTYISSVPDSQNQSGLGFYWVCPQPFTTFCQSNTNQVLTISYAQFVALNGTFNRTYTFTSLIIWSQSNQKLQNFTATQNITWYDSQDPSFTISPPSSILGSSQDTFSLQFDNYLQSQNLSKRVIINWNIPNANSKYFQLSNYNSTLTVSPGGFSYNKTYTLTVTAKDYKYPFINYTQTLNLTISSPPTGGNATISPKSGITYQTNFNVSIHNWQSANQPIVYQVWTTNSSSGKYRDTLLTQDWVSSTSLVQMQFHNTYPLQVVITDQSQEQVTVTVQALISNPSNISQYNNTSYNPQVFSTQQQMLLSKIQDSDDYQTKYFYMQQLAQTVSVTAQQNPDQNQQANVTSSDIQVKEIILNQIKNDIFSIQSSASGSYSGSDLQLIMKNSVTSVQSLLSSPLSITDDIAEQSITILSLLLSTSSFNADQALMTDLPFRNEFVGTINQLFEYSILPTKANGKRMLQVDNNTLQISSDLQNLINQLLQNICGQLQLSNNEQTISMETESFILYVQYLIEENKNHSINYNDVVSDYSLNSMYQGCIMTSIYKKNPVSTQSPYLKQYSSSILLQTVNTFSNGLPSQYLIQNQVNFKIDFETYYGNQTICAQYFEAEQGWSSENCNTTVLSSESEVSCECNPNYGMYIGLFTDQSRQFVQLYFQTSTVETDSLAYLGIVIPLFTILIVGYVTSLKLDSNNIQKSLQNIANPNHIQLLQQVSQITKKPLLYCIYNQDKIMSYYQKEKSLFQNLFLETHPLVSIFTNFDIQHLRIARFSVFALKISLYSLACILLYGPNYRANDLERNQNSFDYHDTHCILLLSLLGTGVMMLLSKLTTGFRARFQAKPHKNQHSSSETLKESRYQIKEASESNQLNEIEIQIDQTINNGPTICKKDFHISIIQSQKEQYSINYQCVPLRNLLLILSFGLLIASIVTTVFYKSKIPSINQYCAIISFYFGLFSYLFMTSSLWIAFNSIFAKSLMKQNQKFLKDILVSKQIQETLYLMQAVESCQIETSNDNDLQESQQTQNNNRNMSMKNYTQNGERETRGKDVFSQENQVEETKTLDEENNLTLQSKEIIEQLPYTSERSLLKSKHEKNRQADIKDLVDYEANLSIGLCEKKRFHDEVQKNFKYSFMEQNLESGRQQETNRSDE